MKTQLHILLATAALFSLQTKATADTVPLLPPPPPPGLKPVDDVILQLITHGFIVGNTGADRICGGMDDDQVRRLHGDDDSDTIYGEGCADSITGDGGADSITGDGGNDTFRSYPSQGAFTAPVLRGLTSDTLGIVGGGDADSVLGTATARTTQPVAPAPGAAGLLFTSSQGPYQMTAPAPDKGIESDPFGARTASTNPVPVQPALRPMGILGDEGHDLIGAQILQLMTTGHFTCDPMDDGSLWGDNGTDSARK